NTPTTLQVTDGVSIPAGTPAVAVALSAINPGATGYLKVNKASTGNNADLTLQLPSGDTVNDGFIARLDGNGRLTIYSTVAVDVVIDVNGTFTSPTANYKYTYDGDGLRQSKQAPDGKVTQYTWDHSSSVALLLAETNNNGTPSISTDDLITRYTYGPDGSPLEQIASDGTVSWFHHDQLGTTRLLTGTTGSTTATYTYTPYGSQISKTGTAVTPLGFQGQYTDVETGLVYLRARYYDPATAQFLTRDPLELLTRSPYGYAANRPLDLSDPTGLATSNPTGSWVSDLTHQFGCGAQQIGDWYTRNQRNIEIALLVGGSVLFGIAVLGAVAGGLGVLGAADLVAYGAALQAVAAAGGLAILVGSTPSGFAACRRDVQSAGCKLYFGVALATMASLDPGSLGLIAGGVGVILSWIAFALSPSSDS
ncbi:MAG: hypothetical protein JWR83_1838, partial [Aeromicrobium sp.]|nr:hypothetical protein [Aeromicrobium sp.]